jgi:dynein light chain LC8-type
LPTDIRAASLPVFALPRLHIRLQTTRTTAMSASADAPSSSEPTAASKPVFKNVDMSEEMQAQVITIVTNALQQHAVEKDIAGYIKRECDKKFNPTWHVVVGRNFGSYVTHGMHFPFG